MIYSSCMSKLFSIILASVISFGILGVSLPTHAAGWWCAWGFSNCSNPGQIQYCQWATCSIAEWEKAVDNAVGGFFTKKTISWFITDVVRYFLSFVTLIAVIYVLYAGFQLMTSAGDDEKLKKARQIIIYVLSGIVVMWISYWIVILILNAIK